MTITRNKPSGTRRFRGRIGITLIISFVLLAVLPIIIVVAVALIQVNQQAYRQGTEQVELVAQVKIDEVQRWLDNNQRRMRSILADSTQYQRALSIVQPDDLAIASAKPTAIRTLTRYLREQLADQGVIEEMFLYDLNGTIIASTAAEQVGKTVSDQAYFKPSLADVFVQPPFYNAQTKTFSMISFVPITSNDNKVWGVLAGRLSLRGLSTIMSNAVGLGNTGKAYLVSAENSSQIAPASRGGGAQRQPYRTEGLERALQGQNGAGAYNDYRGVKVVGAYRWLPELRAALLVETDENEVLETARQVINVSVVGAFIAALIAVSIAVGVTLWLTRPLVALTEVAGAVTAGDYTRRAQITRRNEIGDLAQAFNTMTTQLSQTLEGLERRVEERTAALKLARQRAEEASRAKSVFLSNMSHELRTPLNVIIGYTSSMLRMPQMYDNKPLPPVYEKDIQLIMDSGQYLLGLITDILDLSKIEAGKLELHQETIDLCDIFKGVISTSVGLIKEKPVQIRPDFPDKLPYVWADPVRVRQIVLNLMSNAIKFTHIGSVTLRAQIEGNFIRVSVIDTGIGISEKALMHVFDRFQQARHDTDKNYGGTGLGLDISKQLVQMHGGDMTVQSVIEQGSTFSFTIPISDKVVVSKAQSTGVKDDAEIFDTSSEEATPEINTILLVEDEVSLRNSMHQLLEDIGYVVIDTDNGTEVVSLSQALLPDVILLDTELPGIDGWKLLSDLKSDPDLAQIPVIVCTTNDDHIRATTLGVVDSLRKPIVPEQLITVVAGVVASRTEIKPIAAKGEIE